MAIGIKRRRGTTANHANFVGAEAEITIDTDKNVVVVHDGITLGGHPQAKATDIPGTKNSVEIDDDDLQLVGDENSPGNDKYYGTDDSGNKGWHDFPGGGGENVSIQLGQVVEIFDHVPGVNAPDNSGSHKWIKLTADEDGSGQYNEGLLEDESVSGSFPLVEATAEISVGPLAGQVVPLINTEQSYLRPRAGESGTLQMDSVQEHRHYNGSIAETGQGNRIAAHNREGYTTRRGSNNEQASGNSGGANRSGVTSLPITTGVSIDYTNTSLSSGEQETGATSARTATETRTKSRGVTAYMYIGEVP